MNSEEILHTTYKHEELKYILSILPETIHVSAIYIRIAFGRLLLFLLISPVRQ